MYCHLGLTSVTFSPPPMPPMPPPIPPIPIPPPIPPIPPYEFMSLLRIADRTLSMYMSVTIDRSKHIAQRRFLCMCLQRAGNRLDSSTEQNQESLLDGWKNIMATMCMDCEMQKKGPHWCSRASPSIMPPSKPPPAPSIPAVPAPMPGRAGAAPYPPPPAAWTCVSV